MASLRPTAFLRAHAPFLAVFAAFATAACTVGLSNSFGPGQDFHFHVMSAAVAARRWTGDPFYTGLYESVHPLDANTLLYLLLFPLEKLLSPLDAMRVGMTVLYLLGYPVACAVALRLLQRPMWGAILAFPLSFVKSWSGGGYLPFLISAPLFVLLIAMLHRVLEPGHPPGASCPSLPARRSMIACAGLAVLLFLAHGHVYAWTMFVMGTMTLLVTARLLLAGGLRDPGNALRSSARRGATMFAVVAPSILVFVAWILRKQSGAHAATQRIVTTVTSEDWRTRVGSALAYLLQTTDDRDFMFAGFLVVLLIAAFLLAERRSGATTCFEGAFLMTLVSFLVLPTAFNGQGVAGRQFDMALWLLPIVVYPRVASRAPVRHVALVSTFVVFSALRVGHVATHLSRLQRELAGLLELTMSCPPPGHELAYASMSMYSKHFLAPTFHHPAETLAASCGLDTPIHDSRMYGHNFLAVRYRGAPPAKPTFLHDDQTWYLHGGLWDEYEYVLVHSWKPTPEQREAASAFAERIRVAGPDQDWELWQRRARPK